MQKIRDINLFGARATPGQTKGSAADGVTLNIPPSRALFFVAKGGEVTVRRSDEPAVEAVTWPPDVAFNTECIQEILGNSEWIPPLIIEIPAGASVSGWLTGGQATVS